MKKVILTLAMLFAIATNAFSEGNETGRTESFEKYEFKINHRKLAQFLELSEEQFDIVTEISGELEKDMEFAFYENEDDARKRVVVNVIDKNIKNMYYVLDAKQYHKYLRILNVTLNNKGFTLF